MNTSCYILFVKYLVFIFLIFFIIITLKQKESMHFFVVYLPLGECNLMNTLCRSKQAPFEYTLAIISGKWKLKIIYELACECTLRYGELKRNIPYITHKMLSSQLRE